MICIAFEAGLSFPPSPAPLVRSALAVQRQPERRFCCEDFPMKRRGVYAKKWRFNMIYPSNISHMTKRQGILIHPRGLKLIIGYDMEHHGAYFWTKLLYLERIEYITERQFASWRSGGCKIRHTCVCLKIGSIRNPEVYDLTIIW